MRFKGYDCNYTDDFTFAIMEEYVRTHGSGKISNYWGKYMLNMHRGLMRYAYKKCDFKVAQWAFFEITFGLEVDYWIGKKTLWSTDMHFVAK